MKHDNYIDNWKQECKLYHFYIDTSEKYNQNNYRVCFCITVVSRCLFDLGEIKCRKQKDKEFADFLTVFFFLKPGWALEKDNQYTNIQDVFHQNGQTIGMIHSAEKDSRLRWQEANNSMNKKQCNGNRYDPVFLALFQVQIDNEY